MTATHIRKFAFGAILLALPAFASVDSTLLALVPQDATVIAGARVDEVKDSPFGQFVLANMQMEGEEFRKFVDETGFDPRRDLREIVMATLAGASGNEGDRTIIIGKGVFNTVRILAAARRAGGEVTNYQGVEIVSHTGQRNSGAVAFLDSGLAVIGDSAMVKQAIDRRGKGASISATTQSKVIALSGQNQIWFYSAVSPASLFSGHMADPNMGAAVKGGLMESVTQAEGGLKFDAKGVQVSGEATARSDKDAAALADVFRFLAGIVATREGNGQNLLESLKVTSEGNVMKMSLALPETLLEQLFGTHARPRVQRVRHTADLD